MTLLIYQRWSTEQVDFSNVLVQAKLYSKVYIKVPSFFELEGDIFLELNKSLNGFMETLLLWYNHVRRVFRKSGFVESEVDLFFSMKIVWYWYATWMTVYSSRRNKRRLIRRLK